jgi:uncharacterized membrane protein
MRETALEIFLYTHIACGMTALLTGFISIATEKGKKVHRKAGKVFFVAMILVAISAFVISIVKSNSFLLAIGIFSFYLNYFGYRALKNRNAKFKWFDWLVIAVSAATSGYMISTLNIVLVVFGVLLAYLLVANALPQLQGEEKLKEVRKRKMLAHIGNMMGSYIATVTAFVVVNINFVKPGWIVWLLPTALGLPVIMYYTRVWKKKLKLD